jgi:membrane-bound lytic murein transglycosylase D
MSVRAAALLLFSLPALGQEVQVPHKAQVCGIALTLRDDARRQIQADVDALVGSPKYFNLKVERARTYFPTIERILREERVPDDIKFLVLQESALIADAVSVSNAVGYWQFKDFTATEMGLRVDTEVDERMNIAASTRAAAGYLKKNNYYFNNWLMAVQAYQMGAGAAMDAVGDTYNGAGHMEITSGTYWYVKKFLAHKFAYESFVKEKGKMQIQVVETSSGPSLDELAAQFHITPSELREYNKWIRSDKVPSDKSYAVVVPSGNADEGFTSLLVTSSKASRAEPPSKKATSDAPENYVPVGRLKRNAGLRAIVAQPGDSWTTLAADGGIGLTELLRFNDREISDPVVTGELYYTEKKKTRADAERHTVKAGEGWWEISQLYGLREARLMRYNRISPGDPDPKVGTVVYLQPRGFSAEEAAGVVAEPQPLQEFEWDTGETAVLESDQPGLEPPVIVIQSDSMHIVRKGETMYSIAKAYGLQVGDLAARNGIADGEPLKDGQMIRIKPAPPNESVRPETADYYEVLPTDTLYGIARAHGITVSELMAWNGKTDFTISVGDRLRVRPKTD